MVPMAAVMAVSVRSVSHSCEVGRFMMQFSIWIVIGFIDVPLQRCPQSKYDVAIPPIFFPRYLSYIVALLSYIVSPPPEALLEGVRREARRMKNPPLSQFYS